MMNQSEKTALAYHTLIPIRFFAEIRGTDIKLLIINLNFLDRETVVPKSNR